MPLVDVGQPCRLLPRQTGSLPKFLQLTANIQRFVDAVNAAPA
jgi:hypothetical protein